MAVNTITGQAILMKLARDVGEMKSAWITTYTSATSFACAGLAEATDDTYNGALLREKGASVYGGVSDYTGSTKTFTIGAPGISGLAAGDLVEFAWWNADKRAAAWEAINEAIRESWSVWSQDIEVDAASATITLASGTHTYSLPSGVGQLLKVGIQSASTDPITWFEPFAANFEVYGQEGAYTLAFRPGFQRGGLAIAGEWSSRVRLASASLGTFADAFAGEALCLKYVTRESELTSETGTTQLPLDYFWTASAHYAENQLNDASRLDLVTANVSVPQIQKRALEAVNRLARTKKRPEQTVALKW